MKAEAFLILLLNELAYSLRRGPHHPHGQLPVEQKHHHYKPKSSESLTKDSELLHDTKHLEEDTMVLTPEALAKMSPEELEFHYFSSHDYDRNSKLDGLEMLKSIYHTAEHEPDADDDSIEPESNRILHYIDLVDKTLASDDTDRDGYISYLEFRTARQKSLSERTVKIMESRKSQS